MLQKFLSSLDETTRKNILSYLNGNYPQKVKDEVTELINKNPEEAKNSFYTELSFGTGGIRGKMGIGTNRLNEYTIISATKGLANYLKKEFKEKPISVFIGYDNRTNSKLFAEKTAGVLAASGIKAFLFKNLCPTPIVSFGCRYLKCQAAVMITASHNPPEYNGYKVYWSDGGQVLPPHDAGIIKEVNAISDPSKIEVAPLKHPLIELVEEKIHEAYLTKIKTLESFKDQNQKKGKDLHIVYTSLHGTGITLIPQALSGWGFNNLSLVKEQCTPDENFSFAKKPNPEEKNALEMGIKLLLDKKADILIATDPDADRMACVINHKNKPVILSGNQIGSILLEHILSSLKKIGKLDKKSATVKSIVTSELFSAISKSHNCPCFDVLTGFKYIAEKIKIWEEEKSYKFIFGAEESLGFLREDFVRDKDSISSSCILAEAALSAKTQNETLVDSLHKIYKKHGVYRESLISLNFKEGAEGMNEMKSIMNSLRKSPPKVFANYKVASIEDYKIQIKHDLETNATEKILLPVSDVLLYKLTDETKIVIRPSGTEPKIKIYLGAVEKNFDNTEKAIELCDKRLEAIAEVVEGFFKR